MKIKDCLSLYHLVDPKAVTNNELFGYMHRQTREWRDGLFSSIMRDLANMTTDCNLFVRKESFSYFYFE